MAAVMRMMTVMLIGGGVSGPQPPRLIKDTRLNGLLCPTAISLLNSWVKLSPGSTGGVALYVNHE